MGCIPTCKGMFPFYVDLDKKENRKAREITIVNNRRYYLLHMSINQRINIKSAYLGSYNKHDIRWLFLNLHLINTEFFKVPYDHISSNLIKQRIRKSDKKYSYDL